MFVFPAHILTPARVRLFRQQVVLSGGESLGGDEDTIETDGGGLWVVEYEGVSLVDARQARVWAAWNEYLTGGYARCLVPLLTFATGPRPGVSSWAPKKPSGLHYDDPEWPTFMRYSRRDHEAEFAAAAALRDTALTLQTTRGPNFQSGQIFSYGEGRAHRILRTDGENVSVRPPLRGPVDAGTPVSFDFPLLRAKMDPRQDFTAPLARGRSGEVSIRFVEAIS